MTIFLNFVTPFEGDFMPNVTRLKMLYWNATLWYVNTLEKTVKIIWVTKIKVGNLKL